MAVTFWDFVPPNGVTFTMWGNPPTATRLMFDSGRTREMIAWLRESADFFETLPIGTSAQAPDIETQVQKQTQTEVTETEIRSVKAYVPAVHPKKPGYQPPASSTTVQQPAVSHAVLKGDQPLPQMAPVPTMQPVEPESSPLNEAPESDRSDTERPPEAPPTMLPPAAQKVRHNYGGRYRIGAICVRCGQQATGTEPPFCKQ
jgi:hypothetical protein